MSVDVLRGREAQINLSRINGDTLVVRDELDNRCEEDLMREHTGQDRFQTRRNLEEQHHD